MAIGSHIIVTDDIASARDRVRDRITDERLIEIVRIDAKESFKVEDAKLAVEKAYIADEATKVIVLAAEQFSVVVQNKLLKILEEPPPKTEFVLITASKSSLLPTIRSRLPLTTAMTRQQEAKLGIDIERLTLQDVYAFLQEHKRTDAKTMRTIIERIGTEALRSPRYRKDETLLNVLEQAVKALDSGTVPTFALGAVLLKLLAKQIH